MYTADQNDTDRTELFLVDLDRLGESIQVNPELVINGDVSDKDIAYSPDGSQLFYAADQRTDGVFELFQFSLDATDGSALKMNSRHRARDLAPIAYSADSTSLFYIADEAIANRHQLYKVDVDDPGVSTQLNLLLIAGGEVIDFVIPR